MQSPHGVELPVDYIERIKRLRARLGLTQSRLAELMGVSFASVNRWENGQTRPSPLSWQQILRAESRGLDGLGKATNVPEVHEPPSEYLVDGRISDTTVDFGASPDAVLAIVEGERLANGHTANPMFCTEISLIDPLPHQLTAVYGRMLGQHRLRFLLADDAGAGKTIMTGMYIREMLSRRLLERVLIVPPAGLVGNWRREMQQLFRLPFNLIEGATGQHTNPFVGPEGNLAIVSLDTLAGERLFSRLQEPEVRPYDLVVFDEAHKLAADRLSDRRVRRTARYRLAESLSGADPRQDPQWRLDWHCRHLLLLTATPHMGKDYPYYALWRLLEPQVLSTSEAFERYPAEERKHHFIRRTKEEMVTFEGRPIFPERACSTYSFRLNEGEQGLYDAVTHYLHHHYDRADKLNHPAAKLALGVFQRRLASSTYALLQSLERRLRALATQIEQVGIGDASVPGQGESLTDFYFEATADEEQACDELEENEWHELQLMRETTAASAAELKAEHAEVNRLLGLARQVYAAAQESKFDELRKLMQSEEFADQKILIFTEHRDTLDFLIRRLEALGFTGQVARIHGVMNHRQRDEQRDWFARSAAEGGAMYMVATDAAGEGINLQFCRLMVNYDIPWNPARLEQRLGRIHRYGQRYKVLIANLVAGGTREGRVLRVLLEKLERIRLELESDKVFDVVGQLLREVSLKDHLEASVTEAGASHAEQVLNNLLNSERLRDGLDHERRLYGPQLDLKADIPELRERVERNHWVRLLPGYVRRFLEYAAPQVGLGVEGDLNGVFSLRPLKAGAMDPIWPALETYPPEQQNRLTVLRDWAIRERAVLLHPGEPVFDQFLGVIRARLGRSARRGGVFLDPTADEPYLFHLVRLSLVRGTDTDLPELEREAPAERYLVGLRQERDGTVVQCPVEQLLLLKGVEGTASAQRTEFAAMSSKLRQAAEEYARGPVSNSLLEACRRQLRAQSESREHYLCCGYDYRAAELAARRVALAQAVAAGNSDAPLELQRVKERQRDLNLERSQALAALRREPELVQLGDLVFLAHALVLPVSDPEERRRYDAKVETIAMAVARALEESLGAKVMDVSKPHLAREAGLGDHPGFDLLSVHPGGEQRGIEVKGRSRGGEVELTDNEWARACSLRQRYWLYVVYDCVSDRPRLLRIQDPFECVLIQCRGRVGIKEQDVIAAAEREEYR